MHACIWFFHETAIAIVTESELRRDIHCNIVVYKADTHPEPRCGCAPDLLKLFSKKVCCVCELMFVCPLIVL